MPYLSHLLAVASLTLEFGGNEDEAIGALLHDAAEDQGGFETLRLIREEFGESVARIVEENSDTFETPKPAWRIRKEGYIAAVSHKSESACLVSLSDKIHNANSLVQDQRELGDAHWNRFRASKEDSLWYLQSLADEFEKRSIVSSRLVRPVKRLQEAIEVLEGL